MTVNTGSEYSKVKLKVNIDFNKENKSIVSRYYNSSRISQLPEPGRVKKINDIDWIGTGYKKKGVQRK